MTMKRITMHFKRTRCTFVWRIRRDDPPTFGYVFFHRWYAAIIYRGVERWLQIGELRLPQAALEVLR